MEKIILNGSGQGTRKFYLNEKSERVWIDMPSVEFDEAFKEHCIGKDYYSCNGHPSLSDYARNR